MNNIDKYIMKEIIKYLPNQEIFQLSKTSTYYHDLLNHMYFNFIKYRKHPAVFNIADNYCDICNLSIIHILDDNLKFIRCSHI